MNRKVKNIFSNQKACNLMSMLSEYADFNSNDLVRYSLAKHLYGKLAKEVLNARLENRNTKITFEEYEAHLVMECWGDYEASMQIETLSNAMTATNKADAVKVKIL